jgi:hypothetical protein
VAKEQYEKFAREIMEPTCEDEEDEYWEQVHIMPGILLWNTCQQRKRVMTYVCEELLGNDDKDDYNCDKLDDAL